jgi:hypothetical protein
LGTENSLKLDLRNELEMYILVETNVAQLFCDQIITGCYVDVYHHQLLATYLVKLFLGMNGFIFVNNFTYSTSLHPQVVS